MTVTEPLRPELPPLPKKMRNLHVRRGYPVPWFVTWLVGGQPVRPGTGEPDFRVITPERVQQAVVNRRCWVCGGRLGTHMTFVIGPMCAVNRISAEPPSHRDCGDWSARACPFLTRPHMKRNDGKPLPAGAGDVTPGVMLRRNPGVTLVWTTLGYTIVHDRGGVLFRIGKPTQVQWYAEGREATRAEVEASTQGGFPALAELAAEEGPEAMSELAGALHTARELWPVA